MQWAEPLQKEAVLDMRVCVLRCPEVGLGLAVACDLGQPLETLLWTPASDPTQGCSAWWSDCALLKGTSF